MEPNFAIYRPAIIKTLLDLKINHSEIDDIVQDVFFKAYRKASTYDPGKSAVATWLKTIAKNTALDYFRKRRLDVEEITERTHAGDQVEEYKDDSNCLHVAIAGLKHKDRLVLKMIHFEYASYKEVAEVLGVPVNRVGMEKIRAEKRLGKALECMGYQKSDFI